MMLVISDIKPLPAGISLAAGIVFVRLHLDHTVVFNQHLQPAVLPTEHAAGFFPLTHC